MWRMLITVEQERLLSSLHYTKLSISGAVSAVAQLVLLQFISSMNPVFWAALFTLTGLGIIAGTLVLQKTHEGRISDQTATALLFIGHVVYPAFLVIFMLWSWDIAG